LKSISDLEKNITKYVMKNTPKGLPMVAKFTKNYVTALLESAHIRDALSLLDSHFSGDSFKYDEETDTWTQEDSLNFVLRDYCSSVGIVYRPEYKEAILRSLVRKDVAFIEWLFSSYFDLPVFGLEVIRSGTESTTSSTDEEGLTDTNSFTDLYVRGSLSVFVYFDADYESEVYRKLESYKDLLVLVLPARLFIHFLFR